MSKRFVLYRLAQQYVPRIYKSKITITKHMKIDTQLHFKEFWDQQSAQKFIKFTLPILYKTKKYELTLSTSVNEQKQNIIRDLSLQQNDKLFDRNINFIKSYKKINQKQENGNYKKQQQWNKNQVELQYKVILKQNPGYGIGWYKLIKDKKIVSENKIKLGICKQNQGQILSLAHSLKQIIKQGFIHKKCTINIKPCDILQQKFKYQSSIDPKVREAAQLLHQVENTLNSVYMSELN